MSPFRVSVKRKHVPVKVEPIALVIDLVSPPRRQVKKEPASAPPREIVLAFGPIELGVLFDSLEEGIAAVYQAQEALGHKWIRSQSSRDGNGVRKKQTLRCNCYQDPTETHRMDIDPSDHRQGKSGRTHCMARVNLCRSGSQWKVTTIDATHNHNRSIPEGGTAQRPPTADHRLTVGRFAEGFTRAQVGEILNSHNILVTIWWQSPAQAHLTRRYPDILINDNSYNRNNKQYPLSIGIIIDSHGKSRNAWYAFQKKEDTETHAWILRCHLRATGDVHPAVFISDRSGALIAAVALILLFTFHLYCLSHLMENIDKQLARTLGADWQKFLHDFWSCYRAVSPEDFDQQWEVLKGKYPAARAYLNDLYQVRDRWAWAWISVVFYCRDPDSMDCVIESISCRQGMGSPGVRSICATTAVSARSNTHFLTLFLGRSAGRRPF
ncbi:hypothetical protein C8R44DRAFT_642492 [Mycena epipterygia]|nr:hypothetical protein C8R44DRAFT_642492 [Mycena epipterygia]